MQGRRNLGGTGARAPPNILTHSSTLEFLIRGLTKRVPPQYLIPSYGTDVGLLEKLKKINSVEGFLRKLRFTLRMRLNL